MVVIWVKSFQTQLMVQIYSKSLVRAIGKVLLIKFGRNTNLNINVMKNGLCL